MADYIANCGKIGRDQEISRKFLSFHQETVMEGFVIIKHCFRLSYGAPGIRPPALSGEISLLDCKRCGIFVTEICKILHSAMRVTFTALACDYCLLFVANSSDRRSLCNQGWRGSMSLMRCRGQDCLQNPPDTAPFIPVTRDEYAHILPVSGGQTIKG